MRLQLDGRRLRGHEGRTYKPPVVEPWWLKPLAWVSGGLLRLRFTSALL